MYAIKFKDGRRYKLYGNDYKVLLPRTMASRVESELVKIRKGSKTPRHAHDDLEQIYILMKGNGLLEIGKETKKISGGMIAYVPRKAVHRIFALEDLEYIYISCWFKKPPPARTEKELRAYEKKLLEGDRVEKK